MSKPLEEEHKIIDQMVGAETNKVTPDLLERMQEYRKIHGIPASIAQLDEWMEELCEKYKI